MPWLGSFGWLSNARSEDVPWYLAGGVSAANCVAAYQPLGAASLAASYVNLANPGTYDAAPGTAPTWNATDGWIFDGATQILVTGITPDDALHWSMICRFSNGGNGYMMGWRNVAGTGYFTIAPNRSGSRRYFNGTDTTVVAAASTSGVQCIAGNKGYIDAALDITIVTATVTQAEIGIGAWPIGGANYAGNIQAAAIYNAILTPAQVLAISNAMAALPFEVGVPAYTGTPLNIQPGEFTIVILGDTQDIAQSSPANLLAMGQFLSVNKDILNIQAVLHVGDLIYLPAVPAEWEAIDAFYDILDSANIPYLAGLGNHDYEAPDPARDASTYLTYFPQSRYTGHSWWNGGFYEAGHTENCYLLKTIMGVDYIFIQLEPGPRAAVVAWADALLTTYAARKAIVITHVFMGSDDTRIENGNAFDPHVEFGADCHSGEELWTALIKLHDNIIWVQSGHQPGVGKRQDNSDGGQAIAQVLFNFQTGGNPAGYDATMRFLLVDPVAESIHSRTYDAVAAAPMLTDAANDFTYTY